MGEIDNFIKNQLRKDPRLPELNNFKKSKVMMAMKQSKRLAKDHDLVRNLKAVLSMREKLEGNQPGKVINGR